MAKRDTSAIASRVEELFRNDAIRRNRYSTLACRYFQDAFSAEHNFPAEIADKALEYLNNIPTLAIGRAQVDAAVAKIAGVQRPRVQFMTTRSNWRQRRMVDKLDQFNLGVFHAPCSGFHDLWSLKQSTARDAFVFGDGVDRVFYDPNLGRATFERVLPWELLVDPEDAKLGNPTELFWRHPVDSAALENAYGKGKASQFTHPVGEDDLWIPGAETLTRSDRCKQSMVIDHWKRGTKDEPGFHVVMSTSGVKVAEEEWPFDWFPFEFLHWANPIVGFWGASLIEQTHRLEGWINEIILKVKNSVSNTSSNVVLAVKGSLHNATTNFVRDNSVVEYNEGFAPPTVYTPQSFSPQLTELLNMVYGKSFEITGVNQMSATAQKQPGIEANSAIQTMADLQSERFSVVWNEYQSSFPSLARKSIAITSRENANEPGRKVRVAVPGDGFINSVEWQQVDLEEDQFYVQLQTAPSSKWTAASRLQQAENLVQSGLLSPDALKRIQLYFDTPSEMDRPSRQDAYIQRMIERWLDANEEQLETGLVYPESPRSPLLRPPINEWIRLEEAIPLVGDAYLQAEFDEVDDEILEFFRIWLDEARQILERDMMQAQPAQQPQPPQMGPPQGNQ